MIVNDASVYCIKFKAIRIICENCRLFRKSRRHDDEDEEWSWWCNRVDHVYDCYLSKVQPIPNWCEMLLEYSLVYQDDDAINQ